MSDAAPWEDFKPAAAPAGGAMPWEDFKPAAAPAAPRAGAAAIPTADEAAGKPYTPPAGTPAGPLAPKAAPSIAERVTGAVEAGINTATGVIGGLLGTVAGAGQAAGENLGILKPTGTPQPQRGAPLAPGQDFASANAQYQAGEVARPRVPVSLDEAMSKQTEGITGAIKRTFTGPADLREEQTPDSELGQQYTEALGPVMETLIAGAPLHGTMGPKGAVKPALQAAGDVRRGTAAPVARAVAEKAGEKVGQAASKVLPVDPELAKVAQIASEQKYPINVRPDQVIEGAKFSKLAGQTASDTPLAGSSKEANQVAYTRNLIDLLNPEESKAERLTPEVFDQAMTRSGEGIGEITARTPVPEADIAHGMESVRNSLSKATEDNRRIVSEYIGDIQRAAAENDGVLDGTRLKEINSEIGKQARSNADNDLGRYLNNLQDVIQDSVERNAKPEDIQPLRDFRRQYAYGKMVEPLVAKTIDGKVSPAALMARVVATKQGKHYMARSMGGPIGDLAKVGQLIKEPGSSGTAERSLVYGAIKDTAKTAAGIVGGYPAAAAYNLLGPKLTRTMIGKRAKKAAPKAPEPPPEPTTSPGAGPEAPRGGGSEPGPLGDLTPDWETTPGAGGGRPRGGSEPGLVPAVGEKPITRFVPDRKAETPRKRAGSEIPAVPGRPDVPDTMLTGRPRETAATERANRAMQEPGAVAAIKRASEAERVEQRKAIPVGEVTEGAPAEKPVKAGKIPVGEVREGQPEIKASKPRKLPVGEATEVEPIAPEHLERGEKLPTGEATELTPELIEADKKWRTDHKLGEEDAGRARDVARALGYDEKAVERAARQHDNSPRAFDREIARINEEGQARENESNQAARRSESDASSAGAPGGRDGAAPVRSGEGDRNGAASVRETETRPEPASAVRAAAEQPGTDRPAAAGTERGGAEPAGRQGQVARDAARANGVEIVEVPGGFEARREGKKVGYLKDNLERGQAELLGENANVSMVKVDKGEAGQGTGRALYEAFNEKHGGRILPSGKTEPSAWALWKRNYPEKVTQFVKDEAQRIRDGADPGIVARNITDAEVRSRVLKESERGPDTKPDDQPRGVREAGQESLHEDGGSGKEAGIEEGSQKPDQNRVGPPEEGGGPLDKRTSGPRVPVGSAEAMDAALREKFGDSLIQGLLDQGMLKFEAEGKRPTQGATFRQGLTDKSQPAATLFYKTLTAEELPGVLMHELGEHFGIVRLLGAERYNVMLNELKALRHTDEVREVWDKVKRNYSARDDRIPEGGLVFMREVAAHLVEEHPDLPFVRRIVNEIRAFFYEHFGTTMGNRVDANLIRGLAASALRKASSGDLPNMKKGVSAFVPPKAPTNPSAPRRFVQ